MDSSGKDIVDLTGDSDDDTQQSATASSIQAVEPDKSTNVMEEEKENKKDRKTQRKKMARIRKIGDFFCDRATQRHVHSRFQLSRLVKIPTNGQSVVLANPATQHIGTTLLDRGWACGYRNCQMLLSSVLSCAKEGSNEIAESSLTDATPSVRKLQEMLEMAWSEGFDFDGAQQLGYRVVGTKKWIGTTEIYCILAHLGIRAGIVDFHCPTASDGSHPALFSWVFEYFTDGQTDASISKVPIDQINNENDDASVRFIAKHPLYLQHQGHSRTVVGIEMGESGICLLVFDPDVDPGPGNRLSLFRYTMFASRGMDQYQILYVMDTDNTRDIPKHISSRRIP